MKALRRFVLLAASLTSGLGAAQPNGLDGAELPPNVRPDEQRSQQPLIVDLFGRPVTLRLGYELSMERRGNFDLNLARDRDRRTRDQELKADARVKLSPRTTLFVQAVAVSEVRRQPATRTITRAEGLQRGELWALFDELGGLPLALQVGRIPLVDSRTSWWDEDLDALRLMARGADWSAEAGVGREWARKASFDPGIDQRNRGVWRWFGQARWTWSPRQSVEAFWLHANDRSGVPEPGSLWSVSDADASDARLLWIGLRASGNRRLGAGRRWAYWAELGHVQGRETLTTFGDGALGNRQALASDSRRVRGQALDLGASWTFTDTWRPTLTLGWAAGSGAAPGAAIDRNYRQTGLQENKVRMSGMKRMKRYGELLDPELSNLRIGTLSLAVRPLANASAELVWQHYRQAVASPLLADARLSQAPQGLRRAIGQEFDLLFAWRPTRQLELTLLLARFLPGAAFADNRRDAATSLELGLDLKF